MTRTRVRIGRSESISTAMMRGAEKITAEQVGAKPSEAGNAYGACLGGTGNGTPLPVGSASESGDHGQAITLAHATQRRGMLVRGDAGGGSELVQGGLLDLADALLGQAEAACKDVVG